MRCAWYLRALVWIGRYLRNLRNFERPGQYLRVLEEAALQHTGDVSQIPGGRHEPRRQGHPVSDRRGLTRNRCTQTAVYQSPVRTFEISLLDAERLKYVLAIYFCERLACHLFDDQTEQLIARVTVVMPCPGTK